MELSKQVLTLEIQLEMFDNKLRGFPLRFEFHFFEWWQIITTDTEPRLNLKYIVKQPAKT